MQAINNYQLDFPPLSSPITTPPHPKSHHETPLSSHPAALPKQQANKTNFKWTFEEHARYIFFLEMNKLKIKSKLIRKSNAFFKEMEKFLESKTALQCRSHHQKFEERYKFPHRIITGEKKYIPQEIYRTVAAQAHLTDIIKNNQKPTPHPAPSPPPEAMPTAARECATVCCQTEICDVRKSLYAGGSIQQPVSFNYPFSVLDPYMYYQPYPYHFSS